MHYAVPIAVLASLATIGLAAPAPQNDSGDDSRCGISLFIGNGNPTCNVNTSNKPGGHGQSADLEITGDCPGTFSATDIYTDGLFGTMSFEIQELDEGHSCNSDENGGYCYPILTYGGRGYDMVKDPACTNGGRHPDGLRGWWWRCQVTCPSGA